MELKPCPFCGGKAKLHTRQLRFIGQNYLGSKKIRMAAQVFCNRCKARGAVFSGEVIDPWNKDFNAPFDWMKEQAVVAWNRRADNGN